MCVLLHVLEENEHCADARAGNVADELGGGGLLDERFDPRQIVEEVHDGDLAVGGSRADGYQSADLDAPDRDEVENQEDQIAVGTGDLETCTGKRRYVVDDHGVVVSDLLVGVRGRLEVNAEAHAAHWFYSTQKRLSATSNTRR